MRANKLIIVLCLLVFNNCATTRGSREVCALWNWWPSNDEWHNALVNAGNHPGTWIPIFGAAVISAGGWDQDISDWAVKERPIFGSHNAAQDASGMLCSSAHIGMIVTSLTVPSNDNLWLFSLTKRIVWEHVGVFTATSLTDPIKRYTDRDRPHGGKRSFPSWHATRTASYVGMGNRNIKLAKVSTPYHCSAQFVLTSLVAVAGWARIEAREHYPTDVLFGAALGNFIAILVHDAFLIESEHNEVNIRIDGEGVISLVFEMKF